MRFPSVVAHDLLDEDSAAGRLLLYAEKELPRPSGFDPASHGRLRSYPGKKEELAKARARGHPAAGARFAGRLAVLYGSDRVTLGERGDEDNVDALVHKVLLKTGSGVRRVEIDYVVDGGPKSASIERYAAIPRDVEMMRWTFARPEPERLALRVTGRVVDSAACAVAALPAELSLERLGCALVVDIGYVRTKLAVVTPEGCAHQEELDGLGFSDCVRRILRDGQDDGLVADEFAVIWALERSRRTIDVAGRTYDVQAMLEAARGALVDELGRAVRRVLMAHFGRSAASCRAVAILGGGAVALGEALEAHLRGLELGLETIWVSRDPGFALVEGAQKLAEVS